MGQQKCGPGRMQESFRGSKSEGEGVSGDRNKSGIEEDSAGVRGSADGRCTEDGNSGRERI
eukprot:4945052-Pleurochrysis_carterae.AAC.2